MLCAICQSAQSANFAAEFRSRACAFCIFLLCFALLCFYVHFAELFTSIRHSDVLSSSNRNRVRGWMRGYARSIIFVGTWSENPPNIWAAIAICHMTANQSINQRDDERRLRLVMFLKVFYVHPGFYPGIFWGGNFPPKTCNFPPRIFATSVITTWMLKVKSNANYLTGICYLLSTSVRS